MNVEQIANFIENYLYTNPEVRRESDTCIVTMLERYQNGEMLSVRFELIDKAVISQKNRLRLMILLSGTADISVNDGRVRNTLEKDRSCIHAVYAGEKVEIVSKGGPSHFLFVEFGPKEVNGSKRNCEHEQLTLSDLKV